MTTEAAHLTHAPALDVERVAAEFPILRRGITYLDSAATAQKPQAVLDALVSSLAEHNANIHRGVYPLAQESTEAFEGARHTVAHWINAAYEEVVFTKNVTEAINLVAYSWGGANVGPGDTVLITEMEHHSNIVPWQLLAQRTGAELRYVPVIDGRLDMDALDRELARSPKLLGVVHVSNALGTLNDVETIVARAHRMGTRVLVDGAQAAPHFALDMKRIGADFYGFTGHKVYGPTGIGVLYAKRELLEAMPPFMGGGDMISRVDYQESTLEPAPVEVRGRHHAVRRGRRPGRGARLARRARDRGGRGARVRRDGATRWSGSARSPASRSSVRARSRAAPRSRSRSRASIRTTWPRSSAVTESASAPATTAPSR